MATRAVVIVTCLVLMIAGFTNAIVRPIMAAVRGPEAATTAAVEQVDEVAARGVAARLAAAYLTHDPSDREATIPALQAVVASGGGVDRLLWSGAGVLAPDIVTPGTVTHRSPITAVVTVDARVQVWAPAPETPPQVDRAESPRVVGVQAPPQPSTTGYVLASTQWLTLQVPVITTTAGVRADYTGPVLAAANPVRGLPERADPDGPNTAATRSWASTLFAAYADSDPAELQYLTVPGREPLRTLAGSVQPVRVDNWLLHADAAGFRYATASVTWSLAPSGVDLTTSQKYAVTVTAHDGRWFAAALAPTHRDQ